MEKDSSLARNLWVLVLGLLGISAAGSFVANRGGQESGQALIPTVATPLRDSVDDGAPATCRIRPRGFHRALSLVIDYYSVEPSYVLDSNNRPILNAQPSSRLVALSNRLQSSCRAAQNRGLPLESTLLDEGLVDEATAVLGQSGQHAKLDILIATMPDWVNSSSNWTFDPMLAAVQSAAAADGYSLHSFYLPGWDPNVPDLEEVSSLRVRAPTLHESEPGAVLFHSIGPTGEDNRPPRTRLLLVLIVGETATRGVHNEAMGAALDLALLWRNHDPVAPGKPVRIISPTFSGTASSMGHAVRAAYRRHPAVRRPPVRTCRQPVFEIISHSATSNNVALALDLWAPEHGCLARYKAVVRTTRDTVPAVFKFLDTLRLGSGRSSPTALLVESNTAYGRAGNTAAAEITRDLLILEFPLHLSKLRDAVSESPGSGKPTNSPMVDVLRLPMAESRTAMDKLPPMTPRVTAALAELNLRSELDRLRARGVESIGIIATDRRDHVFLSREIARRLPNVTQFALQPDLLFQHSDVNGFIRGTVVASTYSLAPRVDALSAQGTIAARQFRSQSEQGMFNATLAQLGRSDGLLGYEMPPGLQFGREGRFDECQDSPALCRPPVWISVIGRTRVYPLTVRPGSTKNADHLFERVRGPETMESIAPHGRLLRVPPVFLTVTITLLLAVAWHIWSFLKRDIGLIRDGPARGMARPSTEDHRGVGPDFRTLLRRRHDLVTERRILDSSDTPERRERRRDRIMEYRAALFACALGPVVAGLWLSTHLVVWVLDRWTAWDPAAWQPASHSAEALVCGAASVSAATLLVGAFWAFAIQPSQRIRSRVVGAVLGGTIATGIAGRCLLWQLPPEQEYVSAAMLPIVLGAGALAIVAWLTPGWARGVSEATASHERKADPNRWSRLVLAAYRFGVVCLALASALFIIAFVASKPMDFEAVLFVDRSADILGLVSPTAFVLAACGVSYWWGAWNLRRLDVMLLPDIEVGLGEFIGRRAARVGALTQITGLRRRLGAAAPLAILTVSLAVVFGLRFLASIDGVLFSNALFLATTCVIAMMVHVLAYNVDFATGLLRTLDSVERHVAAPRFAELADMSLSWRPAFRILTLPDLEPFLARLLRLDRILRQCPIASSAQTPAAQIARVIHALRRPSGDTVSGSIWREINDTSNAMRRSLSQSVWDAAYDVTGLTEPERQALHEMEVLVIGHSALILRELAARLLSGFAAVVGGLLILMTGHLLYVFQGRAFWLAFDWTALAVASILALVYLLRLERSPVLRRLWKTESGRLAVLGGIPMRIVGYVVLVIVTMVAVFFPEVGGGILRWAEPVRTLMP